MNSRPADPYASGYQVFEEAAAWHVRLTAADATEADWQNFTVWLETAPSRRLAYDEIERLSAKVDANSEDLRALVVAEGDRRAQVSRRVAIRPWAVGVGLALAASVALMILPRGGLQPPLSPTIYRTQIGEQRDVALADGSHVLLNTGTTLTVAMDATSRRAALENGEAYFDVAKDENRPFIVEAGDQSVEVVGTAFNVLHHDGTVAVTVERGVVSVARSGGTGPADRLTPGDRLVHRVGEPGSARSQVAPTSAALWRSRQIVFDEARLADVIADLNRYFPRAIRIEGQELRELHFTGVLKLDDQDAVVRRLQEFLPVNAQNLPDGVILTRKGTGE